MKPLNSKKLDKFVSSYSKIFKNFLYYRVIDSTNNECFRITNLYKTNTIVFADMQTEGRGRFERKWFSPDCQNLYFSFLLNEKPVPENFHLITIIANSIVKTLNLYNVESFIKWPNDIIVNGKKIAGILIEKNSAIVAGIGININTDFNKVKELREVGISLYQIKKRVFSREKFLINFLKIFEQEYNLDFENLYNFYKNKIYKLKEFIKIKSNDGIEEGVLYDINLNGHLILKTKERYKIFISGEIFLD